MKKSLMSRTEAAPSLGIKASKAQANIHAAITNALENLEFRAKFDHRNDRFTFSYPRLGSALTAYVSVSKGPSGNAVTIAGIVPLVIEDDALPNVMNRLLPQLNKSVHFRSENTQDYADLDDINLESYVLRDNLRGNGKPLPKLVGKLGVIAEDCSHLISYRTRFVMPLAEIDENLIMRAIVSHIVKLELKFGSLLSELLDDVTPVRALREIFARWFVQENTPAIPAEVPLAA